MFKHIGTGYHAEGQDHRYKRQCADIWTFRVPFASTGNRGTGEQLWTSCCSRRRPDSAIWGNVTSVMQLLLLLYCLL